MEQQPKYRRIKQAVQAWLAEARYRAHDKLPSENEIAREFAMSRQTVRQALGELEQEGLLYREQGKGTFVAASAPAPRRVGQALTIGLITTYISDYIFPVIVRGVESELRAREAGLLLASTDNEKAKERDSLRALLREPVDGLILEPTRSAEGNPNFSAFLALEAQRIPLVMLNERYSDIDAPCLKVDDELGGYRAAEHVMALGHTRIAGLFKTDDYQGVHRMRGFRRAYRERGLVLDPELLVRYATQEQHSKPGERLRALLQRAPEQRPTALVCYNDQLAVRMLDVIRGAGLRVPEDISLIGFDDSTLAVATEVKLTTLTHPKTEMGRQAVQLLWRMIEGASERPQDIVYEPRLVLRESTAAAP
nr:GntR family transcriptional regulator [Paenibacillus sabuli]